MAEAAAAKALYLTRIKEREEAKKARKKGNKATPEFAAAQREKRKREAEAEAEGAEGAEASDDMVTGEDGVAGGDEGTEGVTHDGGDGAGKAVGGEGGDAVVGEPLSKKAKKALKKAAKKDGGDVDVAAQQEALAKKAAKASRVEEQMARERANQAQRHKSVLPSRLSAPYEVYVKYLPPDCTEAMVADFFKGCGDIVGGVGGVKLMRCHSTGRVIRGFTTFATEAGCRKALSLDLERLGTRSISVSVATTTGTLQAEGTHTPAMYGECVRHLGVNRYPNGVFVDGTFGRGGHTRKILEALGPTGQLHAFDMDEEAVVVGRQLEREDTRFHMHHATFSQMSQVLRAEPGRSAGAFVNGVLIDIGISSPQLDGGRGFRPEFDGPLDMRFDIRPSVETAFAYLQRVDRIELAKAIEAYGGEHPLVARRIADAVALAKQLGTLPNRTGTFAKLVSDAKGREFQQMHPAKMTFQALRIVVNREYDELRAGLAAGVDVLSDGGKLAIITWKHSENAIVVDFSRRHDVATPEAPLRVWYEEQQRKGSALDPVPKKTGITVEEARRPTADEIKKNSRSRSAVLHILRRDSGMLSADLEEVARPALGWTDYPNEQEVFVPSSA